MSKNNQGITIVTAEKEIDQNVIDHYKKTCGLRNCEMLPIKNDNEMSLTEAYNKGLNEAKYDIVVLCHHDLIYNTTNWGKKLLKHFNNSNYGILGVSGTTDLNESGMWWEETHRMIGRVNHKQQTEDGKWKTWLSAYCNNFGNEIIPVVCLDGLFLAVHKQRIVHQFNEDYGGFHFYDITFTVDNFLAGVNVGVVFDIRLTHYSVGGTPESWQKNNQKFIYDYQNHLPLKIKPEKIEVPEIKSKLNNFENIDIIITSFNSSFNSKNITNIYNILDYIKNVSNYPNENITINYFGDVNLSEYKDTFKNVESQITKSINDYIINDLNSDLLLFLDEDTYFENDAILRMVDIYQRNKKTTATLSPRIHYPDNSIKCTGVFLIVEDKSYMLHLGFYGHQSYYNYINHVNPNNLANINDCLMVPKSVFNNLEGFNKNYNNTFEDLDFCIRAHIKGKTNFMVGDAVVRNCIGHKQSEQASNDLGNYLFPLIEKNTSKLEEHIKVVKTGQ